MEFSDFLRYLVRETITYIEKVRNVNVEFYLWEDGGGYKAKFDYGRVSEGGDINTVVCGAIANALTAIDIDT